MHVYFRVSLDRAFEKLEALFEDTVDAARIVGRGTTQNMKNKKGTYTNKKNQEEECCIAYHSMSFLMDSINSLQKHSSGVMGAFMGN